MLQACPEFELHPDFSGMRIYLLLLLLDIWTSLHDVSVALHYLCL
jgi:hypothetical protein